MLTLARIWVFLDVPDYVYCVLYFKHIFLVTCNVSILPLYFCFGFETAQVTFSVRSSFSSSKKPSVIFKEKLSPSVHFKSGMSSSCTPNLSSFLALSSPHAALLLLFCIFTLLLVVHLCH